MNLFPFNKNMYPALRMPSLLLGSILLLTLVTYLVSCTKKNPLDELGANTPLSAVNERGDGASSTPGTDGYVSPTPEKDKDAFKDKVNSSYEFTGRSMYEHLAYFQGTKNPLDYFSPSLHQELQAHLTSYNQIEVGNTIPTATTDAINYVQSRSDLSASEKTRGTQVLQALEVHANGLIAKVDDGTFDSFGNIWFYLKIQEQTILNDPNLPEDTKQAILGYYSFVRNYLKYEYGRGGFEPSVDERDGKCIYGFKLKCWLRYGSVMYLKIIAYTLIILKVTAGTAGVGFAAAYIPYYILLSLAVETFAEKMSNPDCFCAEFNGPSLDDLIPCKRPEVVSVTLNGCGLTQKLTTWNYGRAYSGDFIWILAGATAPDAGNEGNIVSRAGNTVITNFPWLVVTQDSPNGDIIVQVGLYECNLEGGGQFRPGTFNFHNLTVTDPGTITVARYSPYTTDNHVVQIGTIHKYVTYGTALAKAASGLNTITVLPNSPYGQVETISGLGEVLVKWKEYTLPQSPFTYLGKVTAKAEGTCSSISSSDDIFVAIQLQ